MLFLFKLHPRDHFGSFHSLLKKAAEQSHRFMYGQFFGELRVLQLNTQALAKLPG